MNNRTPIQHTGITSTPLEACEPEEAIEVRHAELLLGTVSWFIDQVKAGLETSHEDHSQCLTEILAAVQQLSAQTRERLDIGFKGTEPLQGQLKTLTSEVQRLEASSKAANSAASFRQTVRPYARNLIGLYETLDDAYESFKVRPAKTLEARSLQQAMTSLLSSLLRETLRMLAEVNVSPLNSRNDRYDPSCQQAVDWVEAESMEDHGLVQEIVRGGFVFDDGTVIKHDQVIIKRSKEEKNGR